MRKLIDNSINYFRPCTLTESMFTLILVSIFNLYVHTNFGLFFYLDGHTSFSCQVLTFAYFER